MIASKLYFFSLEKLTTAPKFIDKLKSEANVFFKITNADCLQFTLSFDTTAEFDKIIESCVYNWLQ